jgi:anti-sigma regulatory factor (Ser/Thr protein kinase)
MADDQPLDGPAGTVLDLAFDSGTLDTLRAGVRSHAGQAGLSEDRAEDVVLAVHELAANAVRHGTGTGRLRLWKRAGALYCQVEDGDPPAAGDPAERAGHGADGVANAEVSGYSSAYPLPHRPGHGLWVVRQVADRMRVLSSARGTCATVTFNLSSQGAPLLAQTADGDGPTSRI